MSQQTTDLRRRGFLAALASLPTVGLIPNSNKHSVNVVINGQEVLKKLLNGPIGLLISREVNRAVHKHSAGGD